MEERTKYNAGPDPLPKWHLRKLTIPYVEAEIAALVESAARDPDTASFTLGKVTALYWLLGFDWVGAAAEAEARTNRSKQERGGMMCEWIKVEAGTVLPPRGEKVLLLFGDGEIVYRELEYSTDQLGDSRVGPAFTHFARVRPPEPGEE